MLICGCTCSPPESTHTHTRGPQAPRGPQENPCIPPPASHTHSLQAEWKTSHHHLKQFLVSFQLSSLLLSSISLFVLSCHPAHSSPLIHAPSFHPPPPSVFSSFLVPSFSLFFINFWLSLDQRSQRRSVKR